MPLDIFAEEVLSKAGGCDPSLFAHKYIETRRALTVKTDNDHQKVLLPEGSEYFEAEEVLACANLVGSPTPQPS